MTQASPTPFAQRFAIISIILILTLAAMMPATSVKARPAEAFGAWTLQWSDEFSGTGALSGTNWIYDIGTSYPGGAANWGTGEIEYNTNSTNNVYQSGGYLYIKPIRDGSGNWTSGRVETVRTDFQPPAGGAMAIEGRIQLPNVTGAAAQGYWPAFWALGAPFRGNYWNWPSIGELDILENVNGNNTLYGTFHCGVNPGGPCNETNGIGGNTSAANPTLQAAFHTYRIEWDKSVSPNQIRWYLDGVQYHTVNENQVDATTWTNAFNHGYFIILNVAMGGGWPGNPTSSTTSGVPMAVDYVRVYYANGSSSTPTQPPSGNLALNKPATSSSNESGSLTPNLAVDGNGTTRWSSAFSDPQWIRVDLGSTQTINRVVLRWEAAYANAYQIQTSNDGTNWTTIYSRTSGAGGVNDLTGLSGSGRYVRMYGTTRATPYGYSLYEFEVYGGGNPTPTPTPTGDYTRGVTSLNSTQARIWFTSNVNSTWVDVHYKVNNGGQQNFRMTKNGSTWEQTVSGLSSGNVITYWFTYEKAGLAYDTGTFTYTK